MFRPPFPATNARCRFRTPTPHRRSKRTDEEGEEEDEEEAKRDMRSGDPELRPEFVDALRVLFDILDTKRKGRVSYETICSRFGELPRGNLPPTFLQCVGRVATSDGYVTFERFLAAVKLSIRDSEINNNIPLTRVQSEGKLNQGYDNRKMNYQHPAMGLNGMERRSHLFSSQPSLDVQRHSQHSIPPFGHYAPLPSYSDYANVNAVEGQAKVVMRQKKANTVRSQKEESRMRHPVPPQAAGTPRIQVVRSRPHSTASFNSIASSGMENISWRNSTISSSNSDPQKRNTIHEEDIAPRVARLDGIHREEEELLRKGFETNVRLTEWYKERLESLEKRNRLLKQGLVNLEPAVHEQKLNFLRAHVTELNRRMVSLMETSEKGFPTHANFQRANMPQPADDQLQCLARQNNLLNQELSDKMRQLEELRREKENVDRNQNYVRIQPARPVSMTSRPSAFVRPAMQIPPPMQRVSASPVKVYDTLM